MELSPFGGLRQKIMIVLWSAHIAVMKQMERTTAIAVLIYVLFAGMMQISVVYVMIAHPILEVKMLHEIRYPSIPRLPWSQDYRTAQQLGTAFRDDTATNFLANANNVEYAQLVKWDGGNIYIDNQHIHPRSPSDNASHAVYSMAKSIWARIAPDIPVNMGIFCEDLHVTRSIQYHNLPAFLIAFTFVELRGHTPMVLSIDKQQEWCDLLGLTHTPILWRGIINEQAESQIMTYTPNWNNDELEGYVLRPANDFPLHEIPKWCAKFVRAGHVQSETHWRVPPYKYNQLFISK